MLENEIKVINEIINERKIYCISENELNRICKDFDAGYKMVVAILKNKYNALYESPLDSHYCGTYQFDNPNLQKHEYFVLNYIFKNETLVHSPLTISVDNKNYNYSERYAEEILRLDDKVKTSLEDIMKALEEKNAFIGEERIWFITSEIGY